MGENKDNDFVKLFDDSFDTKQKENIGNYNVLIDMFRNYISQEFKRNNFYEKIIDDLDSIEDKLRGSFTKEQKSLLEKWEEVRDKQENYTIEQSFIYGYCFDKEINLEKQNYNRMENKNQLIDIIYLVNQKYKDDISIILDYDLLVIQYMYIINGEREIYKLLQVKEFEDKFYIKFVNEKVEKIITIKDLEDIFEMYKRQRDRKELTQIEINSLKEKYTKGTKIELIKMYDIQEVPPKTKGIVDFVDDIGQLHIKWENESTLPLNVGIDEFKIL